MSNSTADWACLQAQLYITSFLVTVTHGLKLKPQVLYQAVTSYVSVEELAGAPYKQLYSLCMG